MEKHREVELLKQFRGLPKGTRLQYDPLKDAFVYNMHEEDISDHLVKKNTTYVQFSAELVANLLNVVFEDCDGFFRV
jgi:hypothetical protein